MLWPMVRPSFLTGQGSVIAVRAQISDAAGNRGEASTQLVSKGVSQAPGAGPMTTAPRASGDSFDSDGPITVQCSNSESLTGQCSVSQYSGERCIRRLWSSRPRTSRLSGSGDEWNSGSCSAEPCTGRRLSSGDAGNFGGSYGAPMNSQVSATVPAMPGLSGFHNPMGSPSVGDEQLVNTHVFDVDYQVEDVGPSGVSAVELFVTENGGQQWFRYGNDTDLRSPFQVDAQGEGTFRICCASSKRSRFCRCTTSARTGSGNRCDR
jgi:hypothetical protein